MYVLQVGINCYHLKFVINLWPIFLAMLFQVRISARKFSESGHAASQPFPKTVRKGWRAFELKIAYISGIVLFDLHSLDFLPRVDEDQKMNLTTVSKPILALFVLLFPLAILAAV